MNAKRSSTSYVPVAIPGESKAAYYPAAQRGCESQAPTPCEPKLETSIGPRGAKWPKRVRPGTDANQALLNHVDAPVPIAVEVDELVKNSTLPSSESIDRNSVSSSEMKAPEAKRSSGSDWESCDSPTSRKSTVTQYKSRESNLNPSYGTGPAVFNMFRPGTDANQALLNHVDAPGPGFDLRARSPPSENDSLLPGPRYSKESNARSCTIKPITILLLLLLAIGPFIGGLFITLPKNDPASWRRDHKAYQKDRKLWEAQKHDWEQARRNFTEDKIIWQEDKLGWQAEQRAWQVAQDVWRNEAAIHDEDRRSWNAERNAITADRVLYEIEVGKRNQEKAEWEQQKAQWKREKRKHDESYPHAPEGAYWEEPTPAPQCHSYGKRQYSSRLWNFPGNWRWLEACQKTPIRIHDVTIMNPDFCEDFGDLGGVVGHWMVDFGEASCRPFFGDFSDKGCIGKGSGYRRIEAQIFDVQPGDDWLTMCSMTPATIDGIYYPAPTRCDARMSNGPGATWSIPDVNC